jgi:hypothetical protein
MELAICGYDVGSHNLLLKTRRTEMPRNAHVNGLHLLLRMWDDARKGV